ncbi:hypothetical protein [Agaribacterium haliotis]|uniref:hypothetical protein n=1 Tax=Agaribacterium haliotis TaxID=2013869 RepID=UPI000BB5709D|nr:hypothetical protein [Agaribacterium haliotis]
MFKNAQLQQASAGVSDKVVALPNRHIHPQAAQQTAAAAPSARLRDEVEKLRRYAKRIQGDRDIFRSEALRLVQKCEQLEQDLAAAQQQRQRQKQQKKAQLKKQLLAQLKHVVKFSLKLGCQLTDKLARLSKTIKQDYKQQLSLRAEKRAQQRAVDAHKKLKQARYKRQVLMAKHQPSMRQRSTKNTDFSAWQVHPRR